MDRDTHEIKAQSSGKLLNPQEREAALKALRTPRPAAPASIELTSQMAERLAQHLEATRVAPEYMERLIRPVYAVLLDASDSPALADGASALDSFAVLVDNLRQLSALESRLLVAEARCAMYERLPAPPIDPAASELAGAARTAGGGFNLSMTDPMHLAQAMAGAFGGLLDDKVQNYIDIPMRTDDGKLFTVRIQRHEGKTPHELRLEAEGKTALILQALRPFMGTLAEATSNPDGASLKLTREQALALLDAMNAPAHGVRKFLDHLAGLEDEAEDLKHRMHEGGQLLVAQAISRLEVAIDNATEGGCYKPSVQEALELLNQTTLTTDKPKAGSLRDMFARGRAMLDKVAKDCTRLQADLTNIAGGDMEAKVVWARIAEREACAKVASDVAKERRTMAARLEDVVDPLGDDLPTAHQRAQIQHQAIQEIVRQEAMAQSIAQAILDRTTPEEQSLRE